METPPPSDSFNDFGYRKKKPVRPDSDPGSARSFRKPYGAGGGAGSFQRPDRPPRREGEGGGGGFRRPYAPRAEGEGGGYNRPYGPRKPYGPPRSEGEGGGGGFRRP